MLVSYIYLNVKLITWNNITWFLAGLTSVLVMSGMFVDLLMWVEHHQKVSLKLEWLWKILNNGR